MQVLSGKRLQNTLARPSISLGSQLIICATLLFTPFRAGITDEAMNKISLPHSYSRFFCHTILQRSLLPARRINGIFLRENRRRGRNPHTNGKKKGKKEERKERRRAQSRVLMACMYYFNFWLKSCNSHLNYFLMLILAKHK